MSGIVKTANFFNNPSKCQQRCDRLPPRPHCCLTHTNEKNYEDYPISSILLIYQSDNNNVIDYHHILTVAQTHMNEWSCGPRVD